MLSPWFLLCCSAGAFYMGRTSPRYNRAFDFLCGIFLAFGSLQLGFGS